MVSPAGAKVLYLQLVLLIIFLFIVKFIRYRCNTLFCRERIKIDFFTKKIFDYFYLDGNRNFSIGETGTE